MPAETRTSNLEAALTEDAKNNKPEIVSELLRRGANEKIEYDGKSAPKWAEDKGHQDIVKIFDVFGYETKLKRHNMSFHDR